MKFLDAREKSLSVKWVVDTCPQGEKCWCRTIRCEEPIYYEDGESEEEYYVIDGGKVDKDVVEHIVKLHNDSIK